MRFLIICLLVSQVFCAGIAMAGISAPSKSMSAHVFYAKVDGEMCPLVGVESISKILVQKPGEGIRAIKFKSIAVANKLLPTAGRITVCNQDGTSNSSNYYDGDFVSSTRETNMFVEVVSDRDLEGVYMVVLYQGFKEGGNAAVTMGSIGDLPAGKLVKKNVLLRGASVPDGTLYRLEFYSKGYPIEQHRLHQVGILPSSQSLRIPWETRMSLYTKNAKEKKLSLNPKPFQLPIPPDFTTTLKGMGIEKLRVKMIITKDGTVELKEADERLGGEIEARLVDIMGHWCIFPEVENGSLKEKVVAIPIQL